MRRVAGERFGYSSSGNGEKIKMNRDGRTECGQRAIGIEGQMPVEGKPVLRPVSKRGNFSDISTYRISRVRNSLNIPLVKFPRFSLYP